MKFVNLLVQLNQLSILNYKNYAKLKLEFEHKLNFFVGPNGAGKTNLLDSIHYLCFCKSNFSSTDALNIKHEKSFFRLDGAFDLLGEKQLVTAKIAKGKRKEMSCNKVVYQKLSEHIGLLPAVMIAPDDIVLVKGASDERRKLLDSTLCQLNPSYLQTLIRYTKLVQQRNSLLKKFRENNGFDGTLVDTYDEQLIPLGKELYKFRKQASEEIRPMLQQYYENLSGGKEQVELKYKSVLHEWSFDDLLAKNRDRDRFSLRTTEGPHRDDWEFVIQGYPLKKYGSQGQQKSYLIAIKAAVYQLIRKELGKAPLLLLDDIFDKLDATRTERLMQTVISEEFGQVFITDTHLQRMKRIFDACGVKYSIFAVEYGKVEVLV